MFLLSDNDDEDESIEEVNISSNKSYTSFENIRAKIYAFKMFKTFFC